MSTGQGPVPDELVPLPGELHEAWLPSEHPLHRPRHSPKQRAALVCALVFLLTPALAGLAGFVPQEIENRPLASFPSLTDGWGLFTGLPDWATDHLPLRGAAVQARDAVSRGLFAEPPPQDHRQRTGTPSGPVAPPAAPAPARVDTSAFPIVIEGGDDWIYLGQDVTLKCAPERSLTDTIAALQALRAGVEASGRQFVLLVAPDKSTMVPEHLPAQYPGKECARQASEEFWRRVPAETGAVDLRPPLRDVAARQRSPIYDRTDTHWTYEGGIVLTYAVADRISPGVTASWRVTPAQRVSWPSDIPPLLGQRAQRTLQAYQLAPDARTNRTDFTSSDFRTPKQFTSAPLPGTVDLPVGMIADSFTQFASPYLAAAFTDITIVHPDTVAADPARAASLLTRQKTIVVELSERHLAGGVSPLLLHPVIDEISRTLAAQPAR